MSPQFFINVGESFWDFLYLNIYRTYRILENALQKGLRLYLGYRNGKKIDKK